MTMIRVLWFTGVNSKSKKSYGGGGWIRSMITRLNHNDEVKIAMSFLYDEEIIPYEENGISVFPMYQKPDGQIKKLFKYWFSPNSKKEVERRIALMQNVISIYKPDIIQIFGTESIFMPIVGQTNVPIIVYLQGLVNAIHYTYYPPGLSDLDVMKQVINKREWLFRNGIVFNHKSFRKKAQIEKDKMREVEYVIGRTHFDMKVSRVMAPKSHYYKLNEMMRDVFYENRRWAKPKHSQYKILSTLSAVPYKGIDTVLRTAEILSQRGLDIVWTIAGLNEDNEMVELFRKFTGINPMSVNVQFKGVLKEKELAEELLDSDVYVHPSYIDNSPNSVCEAQLLGVPVIACNVGGVSDFVISGETGIVLPANDPYQLAYYIMTDIHQPFMGNFSEKSREMALKRHDRNKIVSDLITIYQDVYKGAYFYQLDK